MLLLREAAIFSCDFSVECLFAYIQQQVSF